jgi:parvulin-like peptidyl-prolyl isomerase
MKLTPTLISPICLLVWLLSPCLTLSGQGITEDEIAELRQMELPTDPSDLLAVVGESPILVGDLMPKVDLIIEESTKGDLSQIPEEELRIVKIRLLRSQLSRAIQTKMLGSAFVIDRVGTASAEQRKDALDQIMTRARNAFYEEEIPRMMKAIDVDSLQALEQKLREKKSSIEAIEKEYTEQMLGEVYISQSIPRDPKITLNDIRVYYNANLGKFDQPAKARWEQLSVLFERYPNRDAAMAAIVEMGREAYFGGNLQQVAREKSQEPLASSGGVHDWTRKGSLASKSLDEQIFLLPLNEMSQIIEDEAGLHIIRVLERTEAGIRPLGQVQDAIRDTLKAQKVDEAKREVLAKIKNNVPVYTRYPQDLPGSLPLDRIAGKPNRLK